MRYGVKAALADAHTMAGLDVELLEVHMNAGDLPRRRRALASTFREVRSRWGHELVVHAPEFMLAGGRTVLVDPSSSEEELRSLSLTTLDATIDLAREVDSHLVVLHPGGVVPARDDPRAEGGIDRLVTSLSHLRERARESGVELALENMPWFYYNKAAGEDEDRCWESTLLVGPDHMAVLSREVDGMTLDVSHAYLSTPEGGMEAFEGFIGGHLPSILHLHLSDALPPDHEGLQVGEGRVDFRAVLSAFQGRDVSAVPEILGGHLGGGVGFRRALEELRRIEASLG